MRGPNGVRGTIKVPIVCCLGFAFCACCVSRQELSTKSAVLEFFNPFHPNLIQQQSISHFLPLIHPYFHRQHHTSSFREIAVSFRNSPTMTDATRHRLTLPSGAGADPLMGAARKTMAAASNSSSRSSQYLSRLTDFRQMDIQSAMDQMKTLLSARPHVVYKTAYYRKQTKNHWARDDPAFCALQLVFLVIASIAYSVSFRAPISEGIAFLFYSIIFNWLGCGIILASLGREIANRHLTDTKSSSHVRQSVEWLYAFDIHCNAFFPAFVLLYGVQFFLLPLVLGKSLFSMILSNTLYAAGLAWYWYITHLGYRALPFLSQTEVFLFPVAAIALIYALNLIGYPFGLGWNASRIMAHIYFD